MKLLPYRIFFAILFALCYATVGAVAAEPEYLFQVQPGLQLPAYGSALFAGTADLNGDGLDEWVFANSQTVQVYQLASGGVFELWQEVPFEAAITALHLVDLDGDGVYEVIVAYDDIGILDVIGWSDNRFWKSYSRVYLWSKVSNLDAINLSGFPFKIIITTGVDGSINTLRWNGVNPELLWTASHLKGSQVDYIGSGDFDLDGESDFALVVNRSELQIYSPGKAQLKPVWTNFPWGGIVSSHLVDLDHDRAEELVVASPAGLLYAFEWYNQSYMQKWRYEGVPGITQKITSLVLPQSNRQALAGEIRGDLIIWPLSKSGTPQYHSQVKISPKQWHLSAATIHSILGWDSEGIALNLVEYPSEEIELYFHTNGVSFVKLDFMISRGEVWLPLRQLATLFGMSLDYDPISKLAYLSADTIFMAFDDIEQTVWVNSIPIKVSGGLRKINGLSVLSLSLAESMFNFNTHWLKETAYLFPN